MRNKLIVTALFVAALTTISSPGNAFDFDSLVGSFTTSSKSSVSADTIIKKYAEGSKSVLTGHQNLLDALGFKDKAAAAGLLVKKVTADPNTSADEDTSTFVTDSAKLVQEKLNDKDLSLNDKAKKELGKSMLNLGKGLISYKAMASDVSKFQPSISSIGGAAGAAASIVKSVPGDTNNLYSLLSNLVKYCQDHKIPVPKDATKALADGAWDIVESNNHKLFGITLP